MISDYIYYRWSKLCTEFGVLCWEGIQNPWLRHLGKRKQVQQWLNRNPCKVHFIYYSLHQTIKGSYKMSKKFVYCHIKKYNMSYLKYLDLSNVIELVMQKLTRYIHVWMSMYFGDIFNITTSDVLMIVFEHYGTSTTFTGTSNFWLCDRGR